jgi:hypothetical protein
MVDAKEHTTSRRKQGCGLNPTATYLKAHYGYLPQLSEVCFQRRHYTLRIWFLLSSGSWNHLGGQSRVGGLAGDIIQVYQIALDKEADFLFHISRAAVGSGFVRKSRI